MSLIKKNELKQMNEQQMNGKLVELEKELLKLNGQRAMHTTLENPGKVKLIRKTKARILTRLSGMRIEHAKKVVEKVKAKQEAKSHTSKPKTPSKETGGKSKRHE
ncbi:50S ribosomal protein L29 [Candidatus Woesearchaeota archaeon]|nr:50S ribosomal protein L29 [Candidatus Woesearchaeota archaeon]